jgi:hypothetical protein
MGSVMSDGAEPLEEHERFRARREEIAAQARATRKRTAVLILSLVGAIAVLGAVGGLTAVLVSWIFGVWFR